ncbi:hypothetical protein H8E07_02080 [bacterium]|nr:hypothetical protein [bacterium]
MRAAHGIVACAAALLCCVAAAGAQTGLPPPAAAPPDTLVLSLGSERDLPVPDLRAAGPDSVLFGGEIVVSCVFPAAAGTVALDSLVSRAPWAEILSVAAAEATPDGGTEVVVGVRLGRAGPYRLAWEDGPRTDQVFHVLGRLGPDDQPSPLRDPRRLGWHGRRLLLALLVVVVLLLLWLRLRRRHAAEPGLGDPLPPPAWMEAAVALRDLVDAGLDARGEGRAYLHELDLIYRRFLSGRFHIGAVEMTPDEVSDALRARRHPEAIPSRAGGILTRCDLLRFSPGEVPMADCRELLREVVAAVADTRVLARYTPVPPDLEISARLSWARLLEIAPLAAPAPEGGARV